MYFFCLATSVAVPLAAAEPVPLPTGEAPTELCFDTIYETHFDFVWRNLRRLGVEECSVDDAAHDVFLVVYRQLSRFDGRNCKSWLFAITQRVAWHYRRSLWRRRTDPLGDREPAADAASAPDARHEQSRACVLVQQLLDQLPDERRVVFMLSELEQMSMPEIARLLAIPLNTAYSRLRLARRDFSTALRHHELQQSGGAR